MRSYSDNAVCAELHEVPECELELHLNVYSCAQNCMKFDECLFHVADKIKNFAVM